MTSLFPNRASGRVHIFKFIQSFILAILFVSGSICRAEEWKNVLDPGVDNFAPINSFSDSDQAKKISQLKVVFIRGKNARSRFPKKDSAYEREIKKLIPNAKFFIDPTRKKMEEAIKEAGDADILYINAHHPYKKGHYEDKNGTRMHSIGVARSNENDQESKGGTPIITTKNIWEVLQGKIGPKIVIAAVCCTINPKDKIKEPNRLNDAFGIQHNTKGRAYLGWGTDMYPLESDQAVKRMLYKWIEESQKGNSISLHELVHDGTVWKQSEGTRPKVIGDGTLVLNHLSHLFYVTLTDRSGKTLPNSTTTYNNGTVKGTMSPDKITVKVNGEKATWSGLQYIKKVTSELGKKEMVRITAEYQFAGGQKWSEEKTVLVGDHDILISSGKKAYHPVAFQLPLYTPLAVLVKFHSTDPNVKWPKQAEIEDIKSIARGLDMPFTPRLKSLPVVNKIARLYIEKTIAAEIAKGGKVTNNKLLINIKGEIEGKLHKGSSEVTVPIHGGSCYLLITDMIKDEAENKKEKSLNHLARDVKSSGCLVMDVELKTEASEEGNNSVNNTGFMVWINKFGKSGRIHAGSVGSFKEKVRYRDEWLAGMSTKYLKKEALFGGRKLDTIKKAQKTACNAIGKKRKRRIPGHGAVPGGDFQGKFYWIDGLGCKIP